MVGPRKRGGEQALTVSLCLLACVILTAAVQGGPHSYFRNEEREPQRGSVASQDHAARKQLSWGICVPLTSNVLFPATSEDELGCVVGCFLDWETENAGSHSHLATDS